MSALANWISPEVLRSLGWALVHFLWQGLALAGLLAASLAICRRTTTRYALSVAALALMVAAPVVTFAILINRSEPVSTISAAAPPSATAAVRSVFPIKFSSDSPAIPASAPSDALMWFVEAWLAGVIFFSLRAAGGLFLVERLRRRDATPARGKLAEICAAVQQRLNLKRAVRFCESRVLEAPAVIGWFRPVVMLPVTALTGLTEEQLHAVIAHELAHVRRLDCFVNLFQIAAESLLFYHPAIWWVNRRIRAERENCCDDVAISVCGDATGYARALTQMEERRTAPALAMAANRGPLMSRVVRMLGLEKIHSGVRSPEFAISFLFLAGALAAGSGLASVPHGTSHANVSLSHAKETSAILNSRKTVNESDSLLTSRRVLASNAASRVQTVSVQPQSQEQTQVQKQTAPSDSEQSGSYIDGLKSAGLDNLTADQLIALKVQGVTSDYVRGMHNLGLKPSVEELIGMKVQGITPDYVREMRSLGFDTSINRIIGMKVQGITPDYAREVQALGLKPTADELIGLKVQGVTADYVREMQSLGLNVSINRIIGMKVQGVTPDYIKEMKAAGVNADASQIIGMKVQGLTPDYVKEMKAVGVTADTNQLIGMRVQGVTPDYVKEMAAQGVKIDVNELIGMKVQGVTPEYIQEMKATGISATNDQLIGMRMEGVTPEYVREMKAAGVSADSDHWIGMRLEGVTPEYVKSLQSAGLQNLNADDYVRAREAGITADFIAKVRSHGFKDLTIEKLIDLKNAGVF